MKKKATLKDIAKDAGCSVTITSRVLGNYGSFSEKTKKAVLKSAEKLNYKPNVIARSLRSGSTKAIGVMVNSVTDSFWMTLFKGIEETVLKEGFQVILCVSDGGDPEKEQKNLELLMERNIDGIIMSPSIGTHGMLKKLSKGGLPFVLIDTEVDGLEVSAITVDNRAGACEAVEYLIGLGHRRIGIVTGGSQGNTSIERLEGYLDALEHHDIPVSDELIKDGNYLKKNAYDAVNSFLDMDNPPTALFICNETMTTGALLSLKEHNIQIPGDLSLVGWDNPDWAGFMNPGLTVVDQDSHRMGVFACQTLLTEIQQGKSATTERNLILKPKLIVRESCIQYS